MDKLKPSSPNSPPLTPINFLERAATVYADCPSVMYNSTIYTWSQTYQRCKKMASSISNLGISHHDVISVLAPNIPAMYELHFAIPMAGAVLNTINLRLDSRTISVLLHHSESKLVFVDYESESLIHEALMLFPADSPLPLLVLITNDGLLEMKEGFYRNYEEMVMNGDPNFEWIQPRNEHEPLTLNYTSGTTSSPKGVVHSHRGTFISAMASLITWSVPKEPIYLWTLPMYHANGWTYTWGMAAVGGINVCLRKVEAVATYAAMCKYKVTHMCCAPVVLNMLCNLLDGKGLEYPVQILVGGSPVPAPLILRAESMGFVASHSYGLTETGGLAVCSWKNKWNLLPAVEKARLKARQGVKTLGIVEIDVIDTESGKSVNKDGETVGEIVLKGGCIMLGYLKNPAGTAKCMKDGWFFTGDLAVIHSDGYLEIKDRSKDVIISGGENLSSVEVESVLYSHPAVNEAAVVARPDEFWGETPCAFLTLKDEMKNKVSEKDIIEFCGANMPRYMVPKMVVFKEKLPKTSTGKIQKFALRDLAKIMGVPKKSRL